MILNNPVFFQMTVIADLKFTIGNVEKPKVHIRICGHRFTNGIQFTCNFIEEIYFVFLSKIISERKDFNVVKYAINHWLS